jgi:hypothetical protein
MTQDQLHDGLFLENQKFSYKGLLVEAYVRRSVMKAFEPSISHTFCYTCHIDLIVAFHRIGVMQNSSL